MQMELRKGTNKREEVINDNKPAVFLFSPHMFCDFLIVCELHLEGLGSTDRQRSIHTTDSGPEPYLSAFATNNDPHLLCPKPGKREAPLEANAETILFIPLCEVIT